MAAARYGPTCVGWARCVEHPASLRCDAMKNVKTSLLLIQNTQSGDEIEQLAEQFNGMAGQLSESYDVLESKVADRTAELAGKNAVMQERTQELERFNRLAVGRELKMAQLKQEINNLLAELGREEKYGAHVEAQAEVQACSKTAGVEG